MLEYLVQRLLYSNHTLRFRMESGREQAGKFEPFYRIIQKTKAPPISP